MPGISEHLNVMLIKNYIVNISLYKKLIKIEKCYKQVKISFYAGNK